MKRYLASFAVLQLAALSGSFSASATSEPVRPESPPRLSAGSRFDGSDPSLPRTPPAVRPMEGAEPHAGSRAYALEFANDSVDVIDLKRRQLAATVKVAPSPRA